MIDNSLIPTNEIWYTTIDDEPIKLIGRINKKIVSNTYKEGKGVIVFKEPVVEIRERDFGSCKSLREIAIPSSVTSIRVPTFSGCSNLTEITVKESNPKYDSREGCNAIIFKEANCLIAGCRNTVIPSSITYIGRSAFGDCTGLHEIVIPSSVIKICDDAFSCCTGLHKIVIPSSVTEIGKGAFSGCESLTSITFQGSIAQWREIELGNLWNHEVSAKVVHCTDGDLEI